MEILKAAITDRGSRELNSFVSKIRKHKSHSVVSKFTVTYAKRGLVSVLF